MLTSSLQSEMMARLNIPERQDNVVPMDPFDSLDLFLTNSSVLKPCQVK